MAGRHGATRLKAKAVQSRASACGVIAAWRSHTSVSGWHWDSAPASPGWLSKARHLPPNFRHQSRQLPSAKRIRAGQRWWGGWDSNPRPRDYEEPRHRPPWPLAATMASARPPLVACNHTVSRWLMPRLMPRLSAPGSGAMGPCRAWRVRLEQRIGEGDSSSFDGATTRHRIPACSKARARPNPVGSAHR